jgi:hypothetical protein
MKQCTYCGREYPDDAVVCAIDGYALRNPATAPLSQPIAPLNDRQQIIDGEHIRLLSFFHFIVAGLALVGMGFLCLHFLFIRTFFANPQLWAPSRNAPPPMPANIMVFLNGFYLFFGFVLATACVLNVFAGLFLRQRNHRIFCMVVAGLNCLQIPFGTALGIFTLMVLSRNSVRESFPD